MKDETKRPWGEYKVIEKIKIIDVNPNSRLSLQYHINRDEFWRIIRGKGIVTIDKKQFKAKEGDSYKIPRKVVHRIEAKEEGISFLEIATGDIDEGDVVRLEDDYMRI
ncbi:MAG: phosphomannose isomerase type II C-terminal cupin domain [Candidatus Pacebacteria bacterium]|nr:phosphomannose isomerase type II C-terminal cupin domain [Candidatus Paceibacterota bacterium]